MEKEKGRHTNRDGLKGGEQDEIRTRDKRIKGPLLYL